MKKFNMSFILIFVSLAIIFSGCGEDNKSSAETNSRNYTSSNDTNNYSEKEQTDVETIENSSYDRDDTNSTIDTNSSDNTNNNFNNSGSYTMEITEDDVMKSLYNCMNDVFFLMQNIQNISNGADDGFMDTCIELMEFGSELENGNYSNLSELDKKIKNIHQKINNILSSNGLYSTQVITYNDFINLMENSDLDNVPELDEETTIQVISLTQLLTEYGSYGYLDQQSLNELTTIGNEMASLQSLIDNPLNMFDSSVMSKLVSDYNRWLSQLKNICYRNNIDFSSIM